MSEPIPESIPTSADPRSRRPLKRARGANTALASQANAIENLMWEPDRPVNLPATSSATKSSLAAPPEIVANVQGSSAGAGSGEFHVYKASRRREYERLRVMDEEAKKEENDDKWEREERERRERDEEKTRRNREKRNKKKDKGKKGGDGGGGEKTNGTGVVGKSAGEEKTTSDGKEQKNGIKKALPISRRGDEDAEEDGQHDFGIANVVQENGITIHDDD